ncbi:MAG: hypothetical protein NC181_00835 [Clostridium sp.]|nr:hypothetical protein [Clostridium sp.]MCM1443795.1 hypothetical protein [Candidatus Amulumruptor caecigallinarius]
MKGFTLVELLAILIVLGLIVIIIVPVVSNTISASSESLYEEQIKYLEEQAKKWSIKNLEKLNEESDFSYCLTVETLLNENYITNSKVINPVTKEEMKGCINITYDTEYNQFNYKYQE